MARSRGRPLGSKNRSSLIQTLTWGQFAIVRMALIRGHTAAQAIEAAGISRKTWAKCRGSWAELPMILDKNDPHGSKVDLQGIDNLVRGNRDKGGRPRKKG